MKKSLWLIWLAAMKYQHPGLEQIRIAVDERNREHAELVRFQESPHSPEHVQ